MRKEYELKGTRVLLLEGFARQAMPMMRALRKLKCHVTTLNSSILDLGYSSHYPNKRLKVKWDRKDENKSFKVLLEVLNKRSFDVIIPLTDFSAILCANHKEELSKYAKIAVNDLDRFVLASDKQKTMTICMENDIPCPKTISEVSSIEEIMASGIDYPFVIKPRTGYGATGFHRIDNREQLDAYFDKTKEKFGPLLVQEYIPQTDIQYKAELFVDGEGNIKSAVVFDKSRWYPIDGGSSCCCATVDRQDIIESSKKLLQIINWRGYADIDFIQDPRDNTAKIMEINPRITGSVKICFQAGVDFARQIVEYETGKKVTQYDNYKKGVRLRYMHTDILWFIKSRNRFRCKPSWFNFFKTKDQIFSIHDPLPWFTYTLQGLIRLISGEGKKKK